jgi:Bacterial SH3 domain
MTSLTVTIRTTLEFLLFVLISANCWAGDAPVTPKSRCNFTAFSDESDPGGLNVRAGPSTKFPVVGKLPPIWVEKGGVLQIRVGTEVTDASNGWFKIRDSYDEDRLTGEPARPTYTGEGWVSGRKLVVMVQTNVAHLKPDASSPVVLQLDESLAFGGDALEKATRMVDCQGEWVQLEIIDARIEKEARATLQVAPEARAGLPPGRFRVWVNKICGLQETSCDGL